MTSIELWGPTGNVNTNCSIYVNGQTVTGPSISTLAWLEQHSICEFCPPFLLWGLRDGLLKREGEEIRGI